VATFLRLHLEGFLAVALAAADFPATLFNMRRFCYSVALCHDVSPFAVWIFGSKMKWRLQAEHLRLEPPLVLMNRSIQTEGE
jgi:hypothetical protein